MENKHLPKFEIGAKVLSKYSSFKGMWMTIRDIFVSYTDNTFWYDCDYNAWNDEKEARFRAYPEDELVRKD